MIQISVPLIKAHRAASAEALPGGGTSRPGDHAVPLARATIGGITLSASTSTPQAPIRYFRQHSTRRLRAVLSLAWWVGMGYAVLGLLVGGAAIWLTLDQALFAANPRPVPWPALLYALSLGTTGIVTAMGCIYCLSGQAVGLLILKYGQRAALLFQLIASLAAATAAVNALWMFGINLGAFLALCVAMAGLLLGGMVVPVLLMLLAERQEVRRSFGLVNEDAQPAG